MYIMLVAGFRNGAYHTTELFLLFFGKCKHHTNTLLISVLRNTKETMQIRKEQWKKLIMDREASAYNVPLRVLLR